MGVNPCANNPHSPSPADALLALHQRLKEHYNSPHWWPADGPFEVIVGAILTQNTNWRNVEKALGNLKAAGAMDAAALRAMPEPALAELIRPSGFFTVKARRLKALLAWLGEDWRERLAGDLNEVRAGLLSVNGVGEETADAILLYAAGHPTFVIDAFTRRILDRVGITPSARSNEGYRRMFMDNLPHDGIPLQRVPRPIRATRQGILPPAAALCRLPAALSLRNREPTTLPRKLTARHTATPIIRQKQPNKTNGSR